MIYTPASTQHTVLTVQDDITIQERVGGLQVV